MLLSQEFSGLGWGARGGSREAEEGDSLCGAPAQCPHLPRCTLYSSGAAWNEDTDGRGAGRESLLIPGSGEGRQREHASVVSSKIPAMLAL